MAPALIAQYRNYFHAGAWNQDLKAPISLSACRYSSIWAPMNLPAPGLSNTQLSHRVRVYRLHVTRGTENAPGSFANRRTTIARKQPPRRANGNSFQEFQGSIVRSAQCTDPGVLILRRFSSLLGHPWRALYILRDDWTIKNSTDAAG